MFLLHQVQVIIDLVFSQFSRQLAKMQGTLGHMVAVVFERTLALSRDAHPLLHESIQAVKSGYFGAGTVNQILFFICVRFKGLSPKFSPCPKAYQEK